MSSKTLVILFSLFTTLAALPLALRAQDDPRMRYLDMGTYEGVPYLSGGIGLDERAYITNTLAADYNLKLELAASNGDYVSDVEVEIRDAGGRTVLRTTAKGPWLFARLSPGRYTVEAMAEGRGSTQSVAIGSAGTSRLVFRDW